MTSIGGISSSTASVALVEAPTADASAATGASSSTTPLYLGLMFGERLGSLGLRPAAPGESAVAVAELLFALDKLMTDSAHSTAQNTAAKLLSLIQQLRAIGSSVSSLEKEIDAAQTAKENLQTQLLTASSNEASANARYEEAAADWWRFEHARQVIERLISANNAGNQTALSAELDNLGALPGYADEASNLRAKSGDKAGMADALGDLKTQVLGARLEAWTRRSNALDDRDAAAASKTRLTSAIEAKQAVIDGDAASVATLKAQAEALRAELPTPAEMRTLIGLDAGDQPSEDIFDAAMEDMGEQFERVRLDERNLQKRIEESRAPDEQSRAARALNDMLRKLADVADALHELISSPQPQPGPHAEDGARLKLLG